MERSWSPVIPRRASRASPTVVARPAPSRSHRGHHPARSHGCPRAAERGGGPGVAGSPGGQQRELAHGQPGGAARLGGGGGLVTARQGWGAFGFAGLSGLAAWRTGRIERLTAPDGWLSLVGLHWVPAGAARVATVVRVLPKAPRLPVAMAPPRRPHRPARRAPPSSASAVRRLPVARPKENNDAATRTSQVPQGTQGS